MVKVHQGKIIHLSDEFIQTMPWSDLDDQSRNEIIARIKLFSPQYAQARLQRMNKEELVTIETMMILSAKKPTFLNEVRWYLEQERHARA